MFSMPSSENLTYSGPTLMVRHGPSHHGRSFVYLSAARCFAGEIYKGGLSLKTEWPSAIVGSDGTPLSLFAL